MIVGGNSTDQRDSKADTGDPVIDRSLSQEMQRSPKDRAENVMIVDL